MEFMVLPNYGVYGVTHPMEFMVLPSYGVYGVTLLWSLWCYPLEFMICNYIPPAGANFSHKLVYNFLTGNIPREGTQASTSLLLL